MNARDFIDTLIKYSKSNAAFVGWIGSHIIEYDPDQGFRDYAAALKKSVDDLTREEKQVALFNHVMEKGLSDE